MVGGGQLARMTHQAAIALGQNLRVLATSADESAAQVTPNVVIGSHTDIDDLRRVAAGAHVLTFDHEHVPSELLEKLVAEGVNVAPPPQALVHAQDKFVMRQKLAALAPRCRATSASRGSTTCTAWTGSPGRRTHRWWSRRFAAATTAGACAWRATSPMPVTSRTTT
ncbi:putative phosphoribosylaminoimidazole carboxylase ATPase subunit purK [Mycobacterium kansasii 732]|nr:putative phosphoribosylaminoimidazole carboxylase ATPase subunit purK [Mycobacterium kansasii 732]